MTSSKGERDIDWQLVLGPLLEHGFDADELQALGLATGKHSRRAIRLASNRTIAELPFEVEPVPWYSQGYFLASSQVRPGGFLHYAAGDYYIQDAGSMLALALSGISPGQLVCDTCASPGGKSTGALQMLDGLGALVSNEVIASRLPILGLALCRSGHANFVMMNQDVDVLAEHLHGSFDCVIVDAPCTGQSMIVRGKQSMAAYSKNQIEHSSARQMRIIRSAAALVKPGGRLVYSTCTFSFAENEGIIAQLIDEQPMWTAKTFPELAQWESPGFPGCYRLWPHRDHCAGGFATALERSPTVNSGESFLSSKRTTRSRWAELDRMPEGVDWLDMPPGNEGVLYQRGKQIHRFQANCDPLWLDLAVSGVPLAEEHSARTQPLYGSSVVGDSCVVRHYVELDDEQARRYVAGETLRNIAMQSKGEPNGWCVVLWRGRKLAWAKLAGGALKNHFPKMLRAPNLS